ncbi:MAG TPA: CmpA/NrtA family ABC transporter substrate-binding protein [Alphaproteobacteria bacterium]|jgi:nitrate/nitrite transport system substrate-binding protein|nr:CmpA/NrtA family ABC transporter substrate-binding protein [Alphaproteobacteria bacterium]
MSEKQKSSSRTDAAPAITRRRVLKDGARIAGTAALMAAVRSAFPAGVFAQAAGPETTKATFGYIALTDSSPLIIAKEKGLFAKYGLPNVEVTKQASWASTRDSIELGSGAGGIDGAHILTPMPYLITSGKVTKNNQPLPMYIMARLNVNGQCISVAKEHLPTGVKLDSSVLKASFRKMAAAGKEVRCAMTFPGGTHDMWIRYWLAAGGIDPDKDVQTIVVPPPQMVANMKVGTMEAFCVGEPWNDQLVHQNIGFTALTTGELWKDHPEKSFAVRANWADKNPKAAKAALMAVQEAQMWCDKAGNKQEMCEIVARRSWFNVPVEDIVSRAQGNIDYGDGRKVENSPHIMKYWANFASYPFRSHEQWFLTENIRWGKLPPDFDVKGIISKVNREDLWKESAKAIGVTDAGIPKSTSRGVETFFDGKTFDPDKPDVYLASLNIKKIGA